MTRDIDLNIMTNDKEILEEFRERLEIEIKDTFVWALGESAITEMTRTVREENRLHYLYTDYTHYFGYILFLNGINTTVEPISSI